ncbi:hypothetical protein [Nocardioides sp.]|uniref:hypothetical protein n=1 Tax=Nocardioides sp. TaxID=35761 RepID=UPI0027370267|nr:hypothetical protein [Nocardioides sp.]MDP3890467.1 hypothetical protein [Nocardioides sp.]
MHNPISPHAGEIHHTKGTTISHDTPTTRPAAIDRWRQVTVTGAALFCLVGTLVGTGVIGTRVAESSGGSLAADATLLAPAGPAFGIWSVIYLGLGAYTVWQWLPSRAASPRAGATGWLAAASMVLNGAWLLITQQGWLWLSVVDIVGLLGVLVVLARRLVALPAVGAVDRLVLDGTFGLYLGWVAVAACANIAAALAESGLAVSSTLAESAAVATVVLVALAGLAQALVPALGLSGVRAWVAAAMGWGLLWIAVGRWFDEPRSTPTAVAAVLATAVVVGAVGWAEVRGRGGPGRRPSPRRSPGRTG